MSYVSSMSPQQSRLHIETGKNLIPKGRLLSIIFEAIHFMFLFLKWMALKSASQRRQKILVLAAKISTITLWNTLLSASNRSTAASCAEIGKQCRCSKIIAKKPKWYYRSRKLQKFLFDGIDFTDRIQQTELNNLNQDIYDKILLPVKAARILAKTGVPMQLTTLFLSEAQRIFLA